MSENNIQEILEKFCKKLFGNFDWIILNKIFIEFKFVEHRRKILNTMDYFLVKSELISSIKVQQVANEIGRRFLKNSRKITKFQKKIGERLRKFLVNFTLNLGKVCRKFVELQN